MVLGLSVLKLVDSHRMIEWFGLEGTLKIIWFQPPCHEQGHLPSGHEWLLPCLTTLLLCLSWIACLISPCAFMFD